MFQVPSEGGSQNPLLWIDTKLGTITLKMLRSTFTVGFYTLISRFLGFVRDILVAKVFGSGIYSDAYFVAFRIPNLLRSIFAEGALTSAFVPTFTEESNKSQEVAQSAFTAISSFLLLVTVIVSLVGIILSPEIVDLFAPGFKNNPEIRELCIKLTMIMMPYIVFVSFVSLLNGALNSYGVYGASAKAQVCMNIVLIIGGAICLFIKDLQLATVVLSISVIIGGIVQVLVQIPALRKKQLKIKFIINFYSEPVVKTIKLMIPAIFGATIYQLTILITTMFASLQETGAVSWLFYADRIIQLPLGVFSIALASVLLPHLSKARVAKDEGAFNQHLIDSLRYSSFILIPTIGFIFYYSYEIVELLFKRGAFTEVATRNTAKAVSVMSFGIWFSTCHSMITRAFISKNDTKTPTFIGIITLVSTIFFIILFCGNGINGTDWFSTITKKLAVSLNTSISLGFTGLALSSTFSSLVGMLFLLIIFAIKERGIYWGIFFIATFKSIVSVAMSLIVVWYFDNEYFGSEFGFSNTDSIFSKGGYLIIKAFIFIFSFLCASYILKTKEFMETFSLIQRLTKYGDRK